MAEEDFGQVGQGFGRAVDNPVAGGWIDNGRSGKRIEGGFFGECSSLDMGENAAVVLTTHGGRANFD